MSKQTLLSTRLGNKWMLEIVKLNSGKIAGYATEAFSATTYAINDFNHSNVAGFRLPKTVKHKLQVLMRKHGWVEDVFAILKPAYIREMVLKGNGWDVPIEYENDQMARLYFRGDINYAFYVSHFKSQREAYSMWLSLPKGVLCAMRNAGETLPVYSHDLVDKM